tara:strand:- start:24 stop:188 length:165 start_codon:yes stop_codon:yes gene_type:complete
MVINHLRLIQALRRTQDRIRTYLTMAIQPDTIRSLTEIIHAKREPIIKHHDKAF